MEIRNLSDKGFIARDETGFVARTVAFVARASAYRPQFVWADCAWGAAAVCAVIASVLAAPGLPGLMGGALAATMMAIAAIDARLFIIPDKLVLAGLLLALINVSVAREGQLCRRNLPMRHCGAVCSLFSSSAAGRCIGSSVNARALDLATSSWPQLRESGSIGRVFQSPSTLPRCQLWRQCLFMPFAAGESPRAPRFPSGFSSRRPSGWRGCLRRSTNA